MTTLDAPSRIADLLYEWDRESGALGYVGVLWPSRSSAPRELREHYDERGERICAIARRGWREIEMEAVE